MEALKYGQALARTIFYSLRAKTFSKSNNRDWSEGLFVIDIQITERIHQDGLSDDFDLDISLEELTENGVYDNTNGHDQ